MNLVTNIIFYIAGICAVIFVFVPHEFAHAFVAYKNGDGTAKAMGRLTMNPIKHIDPIGFVTCVLVGFGWAKPVPINPYNFRNYKIGMFTTAIAGIVTNYIIAFFAYLCLVLFEKYGLAAFDEAYFIAFIASFFYLTYSYSLCSVVFNLLPLYPLDGFRVVEAFTRQVNPVQKFLREYGYVILIILVAESFICNIMSNNFGVAWAENYNILNYVLTFARDIIGYPIQAAWGWITKL